MPKNETRVAIPLLLILASCVADPGADATTYNALEERAGVVDSLNVGSDVSNGWTHTGSDVFVTNAQDSVGIGWALPAEAHVMLDVRTDSPQRDPLDLAKYSQSVGGNKMNIVRGRGSVASPRATLIGDFIVQLQSWGYDSNNVAGGYTQDAELISVQDTASNPTAVTQSWQFMSTDAGGTERVNWRVDSNGHLNYPATYTLAGPVSAATPALTSCGAVPAIVGNDTMGTITIGATGVGCIVTFKKAYNLLAFISHAQCVMSSPDGIAFKYAVTDTAITITAPDGALSKFTYFCGGAGGG